MTITQSETAPIAVFGATGAQGAPVVDALLSAGHQVRALARTPAKLAALSDRGVDARAVDLADADALTDALTGVAGVFAHLPFLPVPEIIETWSIALVKAMASAQVPLTVFTLSGPAASSPTGIPAADTKTLARQILETAETPLVGLVPGGYLGNLLLSAASVVDHGELRYPLPADFRWPWISTEDQAALAVAALGRPDLTGSWFHVGEQHSMPELAAALSEGLDRPVGYVPLDPDVFARALVPTMGEQAAAAVGDDYRAIAKRPAALDLDADTTEVRRVLGVPATPVAEWARRQPWAGVAASMR